MRTDELIRTLAADAGHRGPSLSTIWWAATGAAAVLAGVSFFGLTAPRGDIAVVADTPRFLMKFVVAATLAGSAFVLVRELSRPGSRGSAAPWLLVAPALLAVAVLIELAVTPSDSWAARTMGVHALACLLYIPLIGLAPLAVLLMALRHGAPTNLPVAGAAAGLLAGGIAAAVYIVHCPDDSPLFVAVWYTLAVAILAGLGALAAGRFARW